MDNNKESGTNFAFWIPGSAIVLSLVVSTFALTRTPFLELRPVGAQFHAETPIEARLWQDPFDALERYKKKVKDSNAKDDGTVCVPQVAVNPVTSAPAGTSDKTEAPTPPKIMVALVEGGAYADEVELRRRIRYAILAGFKNSHMVPEDGQHIGCLRLPTSLSEDESKTDTDETSARFAEIPYETFNANPFDTPKDIDGNELPHARTVLFWVKQEYLSSSPLQQLERLRTTLLRKVGHVTAPSADDNTVLKVIGPATSIVLLDMYREDSEQSPKDIEIYSPLATADNQTLEPTPVASLLNDKNANDKNPAQLPRHHITMKLLRTVSDDGTMAKLLLEELKLRHVDPAKGVTCSKGAPMRVGTPCLAEGWQRPNRIALISEWDSFYSRALIESFESQVGEDAHLHREDPENKALVNNWVLRFSYLRGLDGRLPEEATSNKTNGTDTNKDTKDNKLDLSPLESPDGNSQLDYLRRLADHIMSVDQAYRRSGDSGIGAIGVLGYDTYDKLLVLQALKSQMPNKVYFSTNLDARMLQRGQAETTRNLVLAAPYGLSLTRALQQDVPPFRESLQSAVFVAVLAAQAPQTFETKRAKFDYSKSDLLSPGIYEVGISGFIPLASKLTVTGPADCAAPIETESTRGIRPHDIMSLRCLQDPAPPPYPEPSSALRKQLAQAQSFFWAGPLSIIILLGAIFIGWWSNKKDTVNRYYRGVPLAFYSAAGLSAIVAAQLFRVEFLWITFVLILLGVIISELGRSADRRRLADDASTDSTGEMFNSASWYTVVPIVAFILTLLWAYQIRGALTENGLGEPMFLFEGISAWPTVALRLLAGLCSVTAIAWGWRNLRVNRLAIETEFHLGPYVGSYPKSLRGQFQRFVRRTEGSAFVKRREALGRCLSLILFPLSAVNIDWDLPKKLKTALENCIDDRRPIFLTSFWAEHCVCGTFGARLLRALFATWIFIVVTSVLFVLWPMENIPVRGDSPIWTLSWLIPTLLFQLLVFWVVDANFLLTRFIRHLSSNYAVWPGRLRREHQRIFGVSHHPCIDEWVDMLLIAKRTAAVSRLIYAPTVIMMIMIASRSSVFDAWPTPPSVSISFLLTALVLFISALSLRRAAERARGAALQRIDGYLLAEPDSVAPSRSDAPEPEGSALPQLNYDKLRLIRARIAGLKTGAFSRYSEEPLVRALLLSLTGIGGSAIVDALNFAKF